MRRLAILICTCDRPALLDMLLAALSGEVQSIRDAVVSVVIVDNGRYPSNSIIDAYKMRLPVSYERLQEPGLVVARNASLRLGLRTKPEYLIFIDDDEVPKPGWLKSLVSTMDASAADLANGPVFPVFEGSVPAWAGDFFTKSGEDCCTSNLIMKASAVPANEYDWFNSAFNHSGGEDNEFLGRLVRNGAVHIVAPTAIVTEFTPSLRLKSRYLFRVGMRDGVVSVQKTLLTANGLFYRYVHPITKALNKLAYGSNHLFWSWRDSGRYPRAVRDFGYSVGILVRLVGITPNIYGRAKGRA